MTYVLDASVAFKWEVAETDSDKANLLRDDFRNGIHTLVAPDFFPLELAHALTRAERQGRISTTHRGSRAEPRTSPVRRGDVDQYLRRVADDKAEIRSEHDGNAVVELLVAHV